MEQSQRNCQCHHSSLNNGDSKKKKEDVAGPKLPSRDDQYSYYSEPQATPPKTGAAKTNDPYDVHQGSKKTTAPISRNVVADKSKQDLPKLVDYDESTEQKPRSGGLPFWAAPSALDDAETNPLRQREKVETEVESLKDDVYNELGLR